MLKTVLLVAAASALSQPKQYFLRFSEHILPRKLSKCSQTPTEADSLNREWPRYCYILDTIEEPVEFLREYTPLGWSYVVSGDLGEKEFDYRVVERVEKCEGEEVDGKGIRWGKVCYPDGREVTLQRTKEEPWTYPQDPISGCLICSGRRIVHTPSPRFLSKPYEPDEDDLASDIELELQAFSRAYPSFLQHFCLTLESDPSGRYFWPEYTLTGEKVEFSTDIYGNYVWDPQRKSRILRSPPEGPVLQRNGNEAACPVLDSSGNAVELELDQLYEGFYWDSSNGIVYETSRTRAEQSQGMYVIDSRTGRRRALSPGMGLGGRGG